MPKPSARAYDVVKTSPRADAKWVSLGGDFWALDHFDATFEEQVPFVPLPPFEEFTLQEHVEGVPLARHRQATDAQRRFPRVTLEVRVRNRRPECWGVHIEPVSRSLDARATRIPVETLLREGVKQVTAKADGDALRLVAVGDAVDRKLLTELDRETVTLRRRQAMTNDLLQGVADVYREAVADGKPPRRAVMDHYHCGEATAKRWIGKARAGGFLGETTPGRKGEGGSAAP